MEIKDVHTADIPRCISKQQSQSASQKRCLVQIELFFHLNQTVGLLFQQWQSVSAPVSLQRGSSAPKWPKKGNKINNCNSKYDVIILIFRKTKIHTIQLFLSGPDDAAHCIWLRNTFPLVSAGFKCCYYYSRRYEAHMWQPWQYDRSNMGTHHHLWQ